MTRQGGGVAQRRFSGRGRGGPRWKARFVAAVLGLLGAGGAAGALELREGFEWNWNPACVGIGWQPRSCFDILGCGNGRDLLVRRTNAGVCGYSKEVRFWSGRPADSLLSRPPSGPGGGSNAWVASHVRDPAFARPNGGTFEILTTREPQASPQGWMQVDLHVPESVAVTGSGEHYLIMHNLNLSSVVPCPRDGQDCGQHVGSNVGGVAGNPESYQWYGVIAGAFGAGTASIPVGSVGFAIEVSAEGRGGNRLVEGSFLPYSVGGNQEEFPAGFYRVRIAREKTKTGDVYSYSVLRWSGEARQWQPIVPDGSVRQVESHVIRIPFSRLIESLGYEIPLGYVGLTAAWFGGPVAEFRRIDFDNLIVDW